MTLAEDLSVKVPEDYRPSEDEPFMNERMQEYFRQKLLSWRGEILAESQGTIANLREENIPLPDLSLIHISEPTRPY